MYEVLSITKQKVLKKNALRFLALILKQPLSEAIYKWSLTSPSQGWTDNLMDLKVQKKRIFPGYMSNFIVHKKEIEQNWNCCDTHVQRQLTEDFYTQAMDIIQL